MSGALLMLPRPAKRLKTKYNPKRTKGKSPKLQALVTGSWIHGKDRSRSHQAKMKIVHIDRLTPYLEFHSNEAMTLSGSGR
ncbi:hypothetical protein NQ315_005896 [Exocentrus adspersus]|uniref:Uncharacterized protein n=1 Tax=Exocentrus adspersus TaxID=1586481 RepID=A0AAV8V9J6_9CUCU|nr:hypothetical protein NQ315_005896 [Exocentrus adspersus]